MAPVALHILTGRTGEECAAATLEQSGFKILERNWRIGHLEIDLICREESEIVFVEVKTRRKRGFGGAVGAISLKKRKFLISAAQNWLQKNKLWNMPCRFDVVCIYPDGEYFQLDHYRNAFSATLDCSNSNW